MRKTAVVLALILVATLGVAVPIALAAPGGPKVVIIVGATHGATPTYRARADEAYAEVIKYTSNVVRVYSPDATWAAVKAAVAGASIVIYMGHGNGWPSPYPFDPNYTTKDGFGLNATAGAGDYNNKYYGEPSVATLDFAPGAIVLLHSLCYAAGNSEPGNPEPTVSVARQRTDNYAAGFLKAGAAAVLADGHAGPQGYLRSLFTTHQTLQEMWRNQANANGNVVSFASSRTPGATAFQDPNTPTSGFYRSLVVSSTDTTTDDVVSGGAGDTGTDPLSLTIPGNAVVTTAGGGLFGVPDTTAGPQATLAAGTRLRLVGQPVQATAEGGQLVKVQGLDDQGITGFMAAGDLAARDSTAPLLRSLSGGAFSPDGDGVADTAVLTGIFSESVAWTVQVRGPAGDVLFERSGSGSTFEATWDGLNAGRPIQDGIYTVSVTGVDAWQNAPARGIRTIVVDTVPPRLTALTPDVATTLWFSPNGDAYRDTVAWRATSSEGGSLVVRVGAPDGTLVRTWTVPTGTGPTAVTWDGRDVGGLIVPDGTYEVRVSPTGAVGNTGPSAARLVRVIGALRSVATSRTIVYPQDGDSLATTTELSFNLARPMTVTWTLRDAAGTIVDTHLAAVQLPAGSHSWTFDGRTSAGTMLPAGRYTSYVAATDGVLTAAQSVSFNAIAFVIKANDRTPGRGQVVTITAVSAESLAAAPRLSMTQPGKTPWSVVMVKSATDTYRATLRLKTGGPAGLVSFDVLGQDVGGQLNRTTTSFPLH